MMGNKKSMKKTKEISSMSGEYKQQQGPRKRGRPRKIIPKVEGDEVVNHKDAEEEVVEGETKRAKNSGGESQDKEEIGEGVVASSSLLLPSSQKQRPRRRARRKEHRLKRPIKIIRANQRIGYHADSGCYPYDDRDPFFIESCPHVYFLGNQDEYDTRLIKGSEGQVVRLICIPRFAEIGVVVVRFANSEPFSSDEIDEERTPWASYFLEMTQSINDT